MIHQTNAKHYEPLHDQTGNTMSWSYFSPDGNFPSRAELELISNVYGQPCECCKQKFGPGELTKNDQTGEMLCEECEEDYKRNEFPL